MAESDFSHVKTLFFLDFAMAMMFGKGKKRSFAKT